MDRRYPGPIHHVRSRTLAVGIAAALSMGATLVACQESSVDTGGGPLDVMLTAEPTTQSVGQSITVRAEVVGSSLAGTIVDFGDGLVDSVPAFGATTQTLTRLKTYEVPGNYTIVARAEDAVQGSKSAQVEVQINP